VPALEDYLAEKKRAVEQALRELLPPEKSPPARLHEAMAYSVFAGGKRIRPILVIAAAEACGGRQGNVMPAACALELIHTYSLIHDDLPCMDDDALRRGKPTSHKVFGEALAVLAGDALLTHAFRLLAENAQIKPVKLEAGVEAIAVVAEAASSSGMVGGQAVDCMAQGHLSREEDVLAMHRLKTGALLRAAVVSGAVLAGAPPEERAALTRYGESLGLLFQIVDDILNVEGDKRAMGKATGTDEKKRKATYPAAAGLQRAKERAKELCEEAKRALVPVRGDTEVLRGLADYVRGRES
jgi:geranylgeranyl diphosphate synthase type II